LAGGEILYCDTDSIVFAGDNPLPEECMDDCAYGKMKVEIDPNAIKRGGFVGMSPKCYAFDLVNGDPYVRCKGVNLSENLDVSEEKDGVTQLLEEMEVSDYLNELREKLDNPFKVDEKVSTGISYSKMRELVVGSTDALAVSQLQFLKTSDRHVSAYENVKVMRSRFDKRMLAGEDGETFPWNDFNINMERIMEECDNVALSNYLTVVLPEELSYWREKYRDNTFFQEVYNGWFASDDMNAFIYDQFLNPDRLDLALF